MRYEYQGRLFKLEFGRRYKTRPVPVKGKEYARDEEIPVEKTQKFSTTATIFELDKQLDGDPIKQRERAQSLFTVTVSPWHKEKTAPTKEAGRQRALNRLYKIVPKGMAVNIYQAYMNRFTKKPVAPVVH